MMKKTAMTTADTAAAAAAADFTCPPIDGMKMVNSSGFWCDNARQSLQSRSFAYLLLLLLLTLVLNLYYRHGGQTVQQYVTEKIRMSQKEAQHHKARTQKLEEALR